MDVNLLTGEAQAIDFEARLAALEHPRRVGGDPAFGIAAFVPAWLTTAWIKAFSFVALLPAPYPYMAPGVDGWMILGVICLIYLYVRDPRRGTEVGLVHPGDGLWQG